ncbi:MAG: diacylglycerol kinase family protein [Anaerolineales bacterium]|nr:diacylglycerol kinase family protein [Anaerolineales bacterium]
MRKINRIESFRYAFAGIWYTLKTQRNAQIHVGIAGFIVVLGLALNLTLTEWAIIALTTGFVWATEMLNTVAEAAMDYATADFDPQVKIVKDVAAGAVLIAAITAVTVGLLILGPRLLVWLTGPASP